VKTGLWLSRRQVRWLIVLLALLPLIPSGLLIQMMVQNALRDRAFVATEMESTYRDQLARVANRFSLDQAQASESQLVDHLTRIFGSELELAVSPNGHETGKFQEALAKSPVVHFIEEGSYAGWIISLDGVPGLPDQMTEQRQLALNHVAGIIAGVLVVAGGVWFTVHRRLRVDELRSDLLTTISHEIKTPVAASKVLIETLESGSVDEQTSKEYLNLIGKENDRMTELADQFLTYSRLEQGQVRVTKKRCTLNRLLEEQVLLLSPRFESAGGRLQLHCEKTWEVETDPRAVKLILMNLLENALKYGGDPPTCEVVARESGKRIEIVVSDGGSGVERSEQKAIFRKFYQGDAELSRGKSGVGLGLAICRQFARLLKGEVYVADSSEGEGASFVFTVPFAGGRKC
jgi:signal transduction histidine kinase